jgi:oligopeptide/dipeptide ABC transporter ATP-binding protein
MSDITKTFYRRGQPVHAVAGATITVQPRETVALVGESGSGKSTLGRLALMLLRPDSGQVLFEGEDLLRMPPRELRARRARLQVVFQEPFQSLDPQHEVRDTVAEPLVCTQRLDKGALQSQVDEALEMVGLGAAKGSRYPSQLSGGEQQRVGIARAIVTRPALIVLDEPTSSLDLTVRAGIVSLLQKLQAELGMSYLFISHDLDTVHFLADRVYVMYRGQIVETGAAADVLTSPEHPYTALLGAARLDVDPEVPRTPLPKPHTGLSPAAHSCPFLGRCERSTDKCISKPPLAEVSPGRSVACWYPVQSSP